MKTSWIIYGFALLLLAAACKGNDDPLPECPISCLAGKWSLHEFWGRNDSLEAPPSGSHTAHLVLTDSAHDRSRDGLYRHPHLYSGIGAINSLSGTYNASIGGRIEFAGPTSTYISGPPQLMAYEQRFAEGLRATNRFEVFEDDRMILYADSISVRMVFFRE